MSQRLVEGQRALHIPSLDGLRALSFLLVFLGHAGVPFIGNSLPFLAIPAGFGVTVFFFLSGYLITTLLRLEMEQRGKINFKHFYLRRALRIWPPFYLVLITACALTLAGVFPGRLEVASVAAQALHYSNYWVIAHTARGMPAGTFVYWSLAVEEHFYLLFPAFYAVVVRAGLDGKAQRLLFFGLCAVSLLWRFVLIHYLGASFDRTYLATDARFDSMLFGCCLAVAGNPALDLPKKEKPSVLDLCMLVVGVVALLGSFTIRNTEFRETLRYSMQGLALYPIFLTTVRFPNWGPIRFLNLRAIRYLGTISYSLYLVHHIVIQSVERFALGTDITVFLALSLSIALSSCSWFLLEKPCAALRKRLTEVHR